MFRNKEYIRYYEFGKVMNNKNYLTMQEIEILLKCYY